MEGGGAATDLNGTGRYCTKYSPLAQFLFYPTQTGLHSQREGMGVLEYQAMPYLHNVAHVMKDGFIHLLYCITATGNSNSSQLGSSCESHRSITYKITPAGSLSSSQPGGPKLGYPYSLLHHCSQYTSTNTNIKLGSWDPSLEVTRLFLTLFEL